MFKPRSKAIKPTRQREVEESSGSDAHVESCKTQESEAKKRRAGITSLSSEKPESRLDNNTRDARTGEESSTIILAAEDAFRVSGIDPDTLEDARAHHERNIGIQKKIATGELEEGVYRGQNAYRAYAVTDDARQASSAEVTGALGPNRAMANLRTTSRFDFQMDVCKDFKETGYCGFGDSCKFLHDRSDYKTGWELEREWNKQQRKQEIERIEATRKNPDEKQQPTDEKEFCTACKNIWADCSSPSCVTSCGHYFCEQCFLSTSVVTCVSCRKPTHGIFNAV